jgi:Ca2+-binding RTX toxin-like protein
MRHGIYKFGARVGTAAVLAMIGATGMGCSAQTTTAREAAASSDQFVSVHLGTAPTFNSHTGAVVVTMSDETAEIYVQASDSSLMINGVQAIDTSVTPNVTAIAAGAKANIKLITVTDTAGAAGDVVILNYVNGLFGQGTRTVAGTNVNLKTGLTNALVIKGQATNDSIAFGANGVTLNNAATAPTLDIVSAHVSTYDVYLGAGDDKFTASGNSAIGGVFASAVAVYGGPGNDTLVEGTVSTPNETFSGGAGTDTVDYSARTAAVSVAVDPAGLISSGAGALSLAASTPSVDPTMGATEGDLILDADIILGSTAGDQMMGAVSGSVTLNGGAGNDVFCQGNDTYKTGTDTLVGGGGVDTVDYSLRTASLTIVMDGKTASGDPSGSGEKDMIGTDIAVVKWGGTAGSTHATVTGNTLNNVFYPGAGTNVINGLAGDDTVMEGDDTANNTMDTFHGGAGTDVMDYSLRTNPLVVVMDNATHSGDTANSEVDVIDVDVENLYGGSGADQLTGNALDNDIEGNGGDDIIAGMAGNDTLLGAAASGSSEHNQIHGNNVADAAESGAFNLCINIGDTSGGASPAASGALAANCQLAQF